MVLAVFHSVQARVCPLVAQAVPVLDLLQSLMPQTQRKTFDVREAAIPFTVTIYREPMMCCCPLVLPATGGAC